MDISDYIVDEDILSGRDNLIVTEEWVRMIQSENEEKARMGEPIYNFAPQVGFQEEVLKCEADVLIIGGKRGGGKTFVMGLSPIYNIDNPLFTCYGFRKEEDDLKRGFVASTKPMFMHLGVYKETSLTWDFSSGAKCKFEQLQNEKEVDRRFRGVEMPHIMIDELPQISSNTFFTLLASNRNTIGVRNKFIASCNPVGKKHWVYRLISWYINEDTGEVYPDRVGKIRYFFKPTNDVEDIIWGSSKEEVYELAKDIIDDYLSPDDDPFDMITSICFIEGDYAENKIFKHRDPSYKGRLAAQGGSQSKKDIKGVWTDNEEGTALLTYEEFETMFSNTPQTNGIKYAVADVALEGDYFVIGAFDGRHLYDIEYFTKVTSKEALAFTRKFLDKHDIRDENFAYDANGIGLYLKGFFEKSHGFNNKEQASNPKLWNNQKSECAEKFQISVKEGYWSVSQSVLDRKVGKNKQSVGDRLQKERLALKRKENDNGRFEIISKPQMKLEVGHSPDFIEMMFMRECFKDKVKQRKNLGML